MDVIIRSVPQKRIRSDQVGDWSYSDDDSMAVLVLETMPPASQFAVAIHELVEAYLCRKHGISDDMVCAFDDKYESERKEGKHKENDEPGDDPAAPYREEHMLATFVERAVCLAIELNWKEHSQSVQESGEGHH